MVSQPVGWQVNSSKTEQNGIKVGSVREAGKRKMEFQKELHPSWGYREKNTAPKESLCSLSITQELTSGPNNDLSSKCLLFSNRKYGHVALTSQHFVEWINTDQLWVIVMNDDLSL